MLLVMELSDVKILIEIILVLIGGGFGVGMWQRFTNKKQAAFWKEKYDLLKIEYKQAKEELELYKANDEKVNVILDFNEEEFENNPDMAAKFFKYMNKKRLSGDK